MKRMTTDLLLIVVGGFIFSIGVNYFVIPNSLSEGGILGLTVIAHYLFGWSTGLINLVLNLSLLLIGYKFFERKVLYYTLFSILSSSILLFLTENQSWILTEDTLLSAVFAGLFVGIGLGLIFRSGGTNGGTTVLARIANEYLGLTIGKAMLYIDIIVVLGSVFVIGVDKGMYTLISVYIGAKVIDFFVDGMDEKVAVFIMSNHADRIANNILHRMSRGITILDGYGGYTGDDKKVLYIVINRTELIKIKRLIKEIDDNAYVTVHQVQEIIRKGYKAPIIEK
ncbi:YitT family protein [Oceanobacillus sp. FSL K6-2867]|uniref:YitT family protein n=1 Tax=Oceanobacillus sp. FSL K6-2867 TaxID=2954748 RepID=UPI0030D77B62